MLTVPGLSDARPSHLTTFTVKADGTALPEEYSVISIEIRRDINHIPKARIVIDDGNPADQTFAISEEGPLVPGAEVEILGGYSSTEATLFKGIIVRHRIELGRTGSHLVIELRDPAFRMTIGRRSRNFTDMTDADAIETIISEYDGLTADVAPTMISHAQIVQHQVSDWDFLVMRAEMSGHAVICVDGEVRIGPYATAGTAAAAAMFGQGLFEAELELDCLSQFETVNTGAWDMATQELLTSESDEVPVAHPGDIAPADLGAVAATGPEVRDSGSRDQALVDQWSAAILGRSRRAAARGRVKLQGTELVIPGTLIELGGLGGRFNGLGLVSGIRHRLGHGDWMTEAFIGTDPRPHHERFAVAAPGAGGTIPPVRGLQIGVVTSLEDPLGEDRIQIRLVQITDGDGLVWARQALIDAGSDDENNAHSFSFRPEIGDEVVLGFLDADPREPVILGGVHSSAKPNPLPGANANDERAIVTRSGMRIHWNDDTVATVIETPNGNRLTLSDKDGGITVEDENGNVVKLSGDGISLESAKDITLKASGDVKIEGVNIELGANASVKANGSSGAELSSGGQTVVKGSVVAIN